MKKIIISLLLGMVLSVSWAAVVPSRAQIQPMPRDCLTSAEATVEQAQALTQQAWQEYEAGRYEQAEPLYQAALDLQKQCLATDHPDLAATLNNLALLYQATGRLSLAESYFQEALAIRRRQPDPDPNDLTSSLLSLGAFYRANNRLPAALALYTEFFAIFQQFPELSPDHAADGFNSWALLQQDLGNYPKAEQLFQQSLALRQRTGEYPVQVADSFNNLAELYIVMERYGEAETLLHRAQALYREHLGPNHPRLAVSLKNLALLHKILGQSQDVVPQLKAAVDIEEAHLARMLYVGSEWQKQAYLQTLFGTTHVVHSLAVTLPTSAARELALTTLLRRKGRILDALANSLQTVRQQLGSHPQLQALLSQLIAVREELSALVWQASTAESSFRNYQSRYEQLSQQEQFLENALNRYSTNAQDFNRGITVADVQTHIPAGAALVEFVRYYPFNFQPSEDSPWRPPHYAAYILKADGAPDIVDLGASAPIEQAVRNFRGHLEDLSTAMMRDLAAVRDAGNDLYKLLLEPVETSLSEVSHLLISPDGALNLIPFEALTDSQGQFLIQNYAFSYLTSGRDLLKLDALPDSEKAPLIVAAPAYDRANSSVATTRGANGDRRNLRSIDFTNMRFGALPGTAAEANALAELFAQAKLPATVLTGTQATEDHLKQVDAPSLLHIATHGFFLPDQAVDLAPASDLGLIGHQPQPPLQIENPLLRSGLALAGANPPRPAHQSDREDGILTALEMTGTHLYGTQLVVLSACETGLGDIRSGQGVYGLRRALTIAGVQSQVVSLWNVSDQTTQDLMVDYYERLLRPDAEIGRHEALRQAQLAMLSDKEYRHPYYWAAFIASGDWRPLSL